MFFVWESDTAWRQSGGTRLRPFRGLATSRVWQGDRPVFSS
jgi:hypothetical protein